MTSRASATFRRGAIRTNIPLTLFILMLLMTGSVYGSETDVVAQPISPDTSQSRSVQGLQSLSSVSYHMGTCGLTGSLYDGRGAGVTYQLSARMQASYRFYLGLVYTRQSLNTGRAPWRVYNQGSYGIESESFHQHEMYGIVGFRLGSRKISGTSYYLEFGPGVVSYGDLLYHSVYFTETMDGISEYATRFAGGIIGPLGRRMGVSLEVNCRLTGNLFDRSVRHGTLIGASLGFMYMVAE